MEKIYYKSINGLRLCGILTETGLRDKMIIMCHGIRGTKDECGAFTLLSEKLYEKGYSSFRFDFNGHGESEGKDLDMTITKEIIDLESTVKMLEQKGYKEFILLGASFGAGIVSLFPFEKYNCIKAIVLWYGCLDYDYVRFGNLFTDENMKQAEKDGYYVSRSINTGEEFKFGLDLFKETYKYKPYEKLINNNLPKLFVHGDSDNVLPYEISANVSKKCNNSTLKLIKNGNHTFMNSQNTINEAIEVTIDFIKKSENLLYMKWIFKDSDSPYEIDKVIMSDIWNPTNPDWNKRGGLNFSNEENILRWVSRGDTLCEVLLPDNAEVINVKNTKAPNGIFVANKVILKNPISISDDLTMKLYKKSKMPLKTYFETIAALAIRGCYNTCLEIIKDKVNMDNIDDAIYEYTNFIKTWHEGNKNIEIYDKVLEILNEIKSDILINLFIDKEPYIKKITDDKIINLTGQSGAGKSTYAKKYFNSDEYLIVDTDDIFSDIRYEYATGINKELGTYFRNKYEKLPDSGNDFDLIYKEILDYCKKCHKTIVIDCAQFHCVKDIGILKGKLIIIRTSINNCYNRTIERYKKITDNYTEEELSKYIERKKAIFRWYKYSNTFIKNIDEFINNRMNNTN